MAVPRWLCCAWLLAAACQGEGSDIGPELEPLPDGSYRVLVLDDQGRGVTSAEIRVDGIDLTATTGRSGRGELRANPSGILKVTVDGTFASAQDSDRLVPLTFNALTPDGGELPYAVYLPDIAPSATLTLTTGTQAVPATLDDSATSGAVLTVAAGTTVGAGTAASVVVATGSLQSGHLPGEFPPVPSGARLMGRGIFIDPIGVTFAPGADLLVPNDLRLPPAAPVDLWYLDANSGAWSVVAIGAVTATGTQLSATSAVTGGGLYAFGTTVAATATIIGQVVDTSARAISGALVRSGEVRARTAGNGTFTLPGIAAELGDGSDRAVTVEVRGGRAWYPFGTTVATNLSAGATVDVGNVVLSTFPVGTVRMMQITRGRVDPLRDMGVSGAEQLLGSVDVGDVQATVKFDDVPARFFGFLRSRPRNDQTVFISQGLVFLDEGRPVLDLQVFSVEVPWLAGGPNSSVLMADAVAAGAIQGVGLAIGADPGLGFVGFTTETGTLFVGRSLNGRGTASFSSSSEGRTVTSAFSVSQPNSHRLEMPIVRANRTPIGEFDRHGLVRGQLQLADPVASHFVQGTRQLTLTDWYDDVIFGRQASGSFPKKLDPATTGGLEFVVGVATLQGHLAAAQDGDSGIGFTLDRFGFEAPLTPRAGSELVIDLPLDNVANTPFLAPEALVNLDSSLTPADLAFDLGVQLPDSTVVDVARQVTGNDAANGNDVSFTLPPLTGSLAGDAYVLAFGGSSTAGGVSIDQRTILRFDGSPAPTVQFLPVPAILEPAPGATVPATGFTVRYTVPAGTTYMTIGLVADNGTELLSWQVVTPPVEDSFSFIELPAPMVTPLVAGRQYQLTITAARLESGPLSLHPDIYWSLTGNWIGISAAEREVNGFSSSAITITTN